MTSIHLGIMQRIGQAPKQSKPMPSKTKGELIKENINFRTQLNALLARDNSFNNLNDFEKSEVILNSTSELSGVDVSEIKSRSRKREVVTARHIAVVLIYNFTTLSLKTTGEIVGGIDHSSVINARQKVEIWHEIKDYKLELRLYNKVVKSLEA